ncbi:MAG: hypothetical protein JNM89_12595 [Hyphomicrobiaceae bacterium]|nr:hypothetical protein [Hyphomicrobiaceae bacterium]
MFMMFMMAMPLDTRVPLIPCSFEISAQRGPFDIAASSDRARKWRKGGCSDCIQLGIAMLLPRIDEYVGKLLPEQRLASIV